MAPTISVLIDLPADHRFHDATLDAIRHAGDHLGRSIDVEVVTTDRIGSLHDGIVIGPGSPYRDPAAVEDVIRRARLAAVPLLAT
ncbi:MAG: hypothetical protein AB7W59_20465 [Acidimicrobiia bacterium]